MDAECLFVSGGVAVGCVMQFYTFHKAIKLPPKHNGVANGGVLKFIPAFLVEIVRGYSTVVLQMEYYLVFTK